LNSANLEELKALTNKYENEITQLKLEKYALIHDNEVKDQKIEELTETKKTEKKKFNQIINTLDNAADKVLDKSGVVTDTLRIGANVGNKIVVELVEKDHLVQEIAVEKETNSLLTGQVDTLKLSLNYSKLALSQADSAIAIRNDQLKISKDLNDILKKDLKTAKRKAFWNQIKFTIAGAAAGSALIILSK
jgi:hypothetical protein